MANYSLNREMPNAQNGDIFDSANFTQLYPNTEIFTGVTGLTFIKCNLINCIVPPDAVVENCNTKQISRCSHLWPKWGLTVCAEECSHMVDKHEIYIDDILIDTIYKYEDQVV